MIHFSRPQRTLAQKRLGWLTCSCLILATACTQGTVTPPESPLLALTPTEFNNTIADLYGFPRNGDSWPEPHPIAETIAPPLGERAGLFGQAPVEIPPWPWNFPDEIGLDDFEGMGEGQVPSPYQVEEIQKAANHFAAYSLVSTIFFTCENWENLAQEEATACGWESLLRFTQRAWRRPITDTERSRLEGYWNQTRGEATLPEAIALTVSAIIQSPAFVFKIEEGLSEESGADAIALSNWEMASRLSYFLWDSMPDTELFGAAATGSLSSASDVATQTRRMLGDAKARSAVISFHHQLLGTDEVRRVAPARRAHGELFGLPPTASFDQECDPEWPGVLGPIRASMEAETNLFIERTIFDGAGSLSALLTDNHGYMSDDTAVIYGDNVVQLNGPEVIHDYSMIQLSGGSKNTIAMYPVEFSPNERAGLLTLPSLLAVGSYAVHPAPILRGKRILERLACQTFGAPPPGAEALIPADTNEAEGTNRERTEIATAAPICNSCHQSLNPPGFAFENYDAFGRFREQDNGIPVDASGTFTLFSGETFTFSNGVELAYQMAESQQVKDCYVEHWTSYAVGYPLTEHQETLSNLQSQFRSNDDIIELLVSITSSDLFRYLNGEGVTP